MTREVALEDVSDVLEELDYPILRADAATRLEGVTVTLADGEEDLGEIVWMVGRDEFESAAALREEIHSYLPVETAASEED